jgi:hypothetical protein
MNATPRLARGTAISTPDARVRLAHQTRRIGQVEVSVHAVGILPASGPRDSSPSRRAPAGLAQFSNSLLPRNAVRATGAVVPESQPCTVLYCTNTVRPEGDLDLENTDVGGVRARETRLGRTRLRHR